jgi:nucleoside phosphorylase/CheY-like chemotaxis protein
MASGYFILYKEITMIKVLILEDNKEKLKNIVSLLANECNVEEGDIHVATNVQDGRELLYSGIFDLLLLDLVLPINDGDDPVEDSGSKLLDEIYYNPNINIPIHIIGLTQFEKVFQDLSQEFEDKLWGLINFNLKNTDWRDKLKSKVFYLQTFKNKYKQFIENERRYDIVILTALDSEFLALKEVFAFKKVKQPDESLIYYAGVLNTRSNNNIKVLTCCINQMGMQAAAAVASKVISLFSPSAVFISGICAGIKEAGVQLGDIIIATQCWNYESGKIIESEDAAELIFKPDMHCLTTNQRELAKLRDFSDDKEALQRIHEQFTSHKPQKFSNVHFGSVGSGPYVLSSRKYLQKLITSDRKLIGIDMEGFGIYKAAEFHMNTSAVFVKSVSDFGDEKKNDNFHEYSSFISAKFIWEYLYATF